MEATPAINRFFDPYSVSGQGTLTWLMSLGLVHSHQRTICIDPIMKIY